MEGSRVYLDHNSTTSYSCDTRIINNLLNRPLNPSSPHAFGREAKSLVELARSQVAKMLGLDSEYQVLFTSSGTEANNLLIRNFYDDLIFISAVEHQSIYQHRFYCPNIKVIEVDKNGIIELSSLEKLLKDKDDYAKCLIAIMLANNETGVIQPIKEISQLAKQYNAKLHTDCTQGPGKIKVDLMELGVDSATISGHKFGGPLGAGALIFKDSLSLLPQIIGGGQEKGMRSGTENVLAIVGLGLASKQCAQNIDEYYNYLLTLRKMLEHGIINECFEARILGEMVDRLPNTSAIMMPGVEAQVQIINFDLAGFAVSSGSACSSGKIGRSHVLKAMGMNEREIACTIRVSLGVSNTEEEVVAFVEAWHKIYKTNCLFK